MPPKYKQPGDAGGKPPVAGPRRIAVIDVGTTALRMDIAEVSAAGDINVLDSLQQTTHLGHDTFSGGRIRRTTIEECVEVLKGYRQVMSEHGITHEDQIRAVGTSSILEADNRDAFLDRIYVATRINVVPIEESEVNRLTYIALYGLMEKESGLKEGNVLIVEVGGGSTKLLLIQNGIVAHASTFRLGAIRMRETLEKHRTPKDRIRAVIDQHLQRTVAQMQQSIPVNTVHSVVAVAGDVYLAMSRLVPGWQAAQVARINTGSFAAVEKEAVVSPDDLVRKYRIPFHEAETAGPALLEYIRIARAFKAKQIIVSSLSLRQGLLVDAAASNRWTDSFVEQVLHSAMSLGGKYGFDRNHAVCVMDLCAALFRELQPEHQLDARYGVLLKVAAILHEIGSFVSNRSHHKHSMYLIMNSDVFGISRDDMLLVALVARYHRRSLPRITHEGFAQLDREMRVVVSKLAAILRVADALDRSHSQRIRDLALTRESDQFVITSGNAEDVTLERLSLEEKSGMFEDLYGRRIILRATEAPEGKVEHAGG